MNLARSTLVSGPGPLGMDGWESGQDGTPAPSLWPQSPHTAWSLCSGDRSRKRYTGFQAPHEGPGCRRVPKLGRPGLNMIRPAHRRGRLPRAGVFHVNYKKSQDRLPLITRERITDPEESWAEPGWPWASTAHEAQPRTRACLPGPGSSRRQGLRPREPLPPIPGSPEGEDRGAFP